MPAQFVFPFESPDEFDSKWWNNQYSHGWERKIVPNNGRTEIVEIDVVVKRTTEKAILVNFGVPEEVWIPKSQVSDWTDGPDDEPGYGTTSIFIPDWLAVEKGMV